MLFLLLAITCSASIALIFKHSETRGMNRYVVTSANYFAACVVSLALMVREGLPDPGAFSLAESLREIGEVLTTSGPTLSASGSLVWAVLVGLGAGVVFFLGFIFYQISIRHHGVGLAGATIKLGILVPMSLSLVLWRVYPSGLQWVGIALAVASIVLANWPSRARTSGALLLLFLFGGAAEFSNKVFQNYAMIDYRTVFLMTTFFIAFLLSLAVAIRKRRAVSRRDILTGFAVGVPNLLSSFFLIPALVRLPAAVAYPAYGAGTIVIITAAGLIFFKERPARLELAAVALSIGALVLINL